MCVSKDSRTDILQAAHFQNWSRMTQIHSHSVPRLCSSRSYISIVFGRFQWYPSCFSNHLGSPAPCSKFKQNRASLQRSAIADRSHPTTSRRAVLLTMFDAEPVAVAEAMPVMVAPPADVLLPDIGVFIGRTGCNVVVLRPIPFGPKDTRWPPMVSV